MELFEKQFEYVMSGAAHSRITLDDAQKDDIPLRVRKVTDKTVSMLKEHYVTALYNAFTEDGVGRRMKEGKFFETPLHADSGGLQIVTRGMKADSKIKNSVYKAQAAYSGTAMCFDEIPTSTGRISTERIFNRDLVEAKAKETAENIIEQAEVFRKLDTEAKIFAIVQGNCYDTYNIWIDTLVKNIPEEIYPQICGLSMAASSSGFGELLDIERMFAFRFCDAPESWKRRLHLLGFGSVKRMAPVVGMIHSGLIDKNILVSYDSTTHSSGMSFRRFSDINDKWVNPTKGSMIEVKQLYDYCKEYYDIEASYEEHYDTFTFNRESFLKKYGDGKKAVFHEAMIAMTMTSVYHTCKMLETISASKKKFNLYANSNDIREMAFLTEVKNKDDYDNYMKNFSSHLKANRIKTLENNSSLEGFFE